MMRRVMVAVLALAAGAEAGTKVAAPGLNGFGLEPKFVEFLNEQLAHSLHESAGLDVLTAREIEAVVGMERQKQLLGCNDDKGSCMTELANALGADAVVLGDVVQLDKKFQVTLKIIAASDAKVLAATSDRVEGKDGLVDAMNAAGKKMGPIARTMLQVKSKQQPAKQEEPVAQKEPEPPPDETPAADGEWAQKDVFIRKASETTGFDLTAVFASSDKNVWAVGYGATAARFDGAKWTLKNPPAELGGVLRTAWTNGPQLAVVAGQNGVAFKWKGQGWVSISDANYAAFDCVHGTADGSAIFAATDKGVLKLNGGKWDTAWAESAARAVFAIAPNDVWAATKTRILHFAGDGWKEVKGVAAEKIYAVWANGPDDVWFAGDEGLIAHHVPSKKGAAAWQTFKAGRASYLNLWGTGPKNMWAAGTDGALMHFDGEDWVAIPSASGATIFGLTGAGENDLWYVQDVPKMRPGGGVYHLHK